MHKDDRLSLPYGDFRRERALLAPHVFALPGDKGDFPVTDLVSKKAWRGVMDLPTDVAIRTTSHQGSVVKRLHRLETHWLFTWPNPGTAPYMDDSMLLAGEEFDALVFNSVHGYYRQAIGCLRNALEVMTVSAGLAITNNDALFNQWRNGHEISFGQARTWIKDSEVGQRIDSEAAPSAVFLKDESAWFVRLYARLCGYSHSRSGYNNGDFWKSNGPIHVRRALDVVEQEFRETLAVSYLLLKIGGAEFRSTKGVGELLVKPGSGWSDFTSVLRREILNEN